MWCTLQEKLLLPMIDFIFNHENSVGNVKLLTNYPWTQVRSYFARRKIFIGRQAMRYTYLRNVCE